MKRFKTYPTLALVAVLIVVAGALAGCTTAPVKAADVSGSIRASLDQAGLKDVSISQERDKGVVTLGGHVAAEGDKTQAGRIAGSFAANQVVSNQTAVVLPGVESDSKKVNAALDEGIESNLDAALIQDKLKDTVKFTVKNHVVTLSGNVDSQSKRARAEAVAARVLNVEQVVNELQVKNQKATSTN